MYLNKKCLGLSDLFKGNVAASLAGTRNKKILKIQYKKILKNTDIQEKN